LTVALWLAAGASHAADPGAVLRLKTRLGRGAPVPLGETLGSSPAVVAMLASYCSPCRAEVPVLSRAAKRWRADGVRVVGIMADGDDPKTIARIARDWGIDFELRGVPKDQAEAVRALVPAGLPAAFAVHGRTVVRHDKILHDDDVAALVTPLLGPRP